MQTSIEITKKIQKLDQEIQEKRLELAEHKSNINTCVNLYNQNKIKSHTLPKTGDSDTLNKSQQHIAMLDTLFTKGRPQTRVVKVENEIKALNEKRMFWLQKLPQEEQALLITEPKSEPGVSN